MQQRQYRCRELPAAGGGVTGAKYACTCVNKEFLLN
jgi:hypothetical protein